VKKVKNEIAKIRVLFQNCLTKCNEKSKKIDLAITKRKDLLDMSQQTLCWLDCINTNLSKTIKKPYHPYDCAKLLQEHKALHKEMLRHKVTAEKVTKSETEVYQPKKEIEKNILNKYIDVDNLWNKRLTEYQDLLASREMFQGDVERVVWWLKQAEIITFPQINPVSDNQQLKENLLKYDNVIKEGENYKKIISKLHLQSKEIIKEVQENERVLLEEKIKKIQDKYIQVINLSNEKSKTISVMISTQNLYKEALGKLSKHLAEGQQLLNELDKSKTGHTAVKAKSMLQKALKINEAVVAQNKEVEEVEHMRDKLRVSGQLWQPEKMLKTTAIYQKIVLSSKMIINKFKQLVSQRESFELRTKGLEEKIHSIKNELDNENKLTKVKDKLKKLQVIQAMLTSCLVELRSISELSENICQEMDLTDKLMIKNKIKTFRISLDELQALSTTEQRDLEKKLVSRKKFEDELVKGLEWLNDTNTVISCLIPMKLNPETVQQETKKLYIVKEEVESRLRVLQALANKHMLCFSNDDQELSKYFKKQLDQLNNIDFSIKKSIQKKERCLNTLFEMRHNFQKLLQNTEEKLASHRAEIQILQSDIETKNYKQHLLRNKVWLLSESEFLSIIIELEKSRDKLCGMDGNLTKTSREILIQQVISLKNRILSLVETEKKLYQKIKVSAVSLKNFKSNVSCVNSKAIETDQMLQAFDYQMPSSFLEATKKLQSFKIVLKAVDQLSSSIQTLNENSKIFHTEDNIQNKLEISRSIDTLNHSFSNIKSRANELQFLLNRYLSDWKAYEKVIGKADKELNDFYNLIPNESFEKMTSIQLSNQKKTLEDINQSIFKLRKRITSVQEFSDTTTTELSAKHFKEHKQNLKDKTELLKDKFNELLSVTEKKINSINKEKKSRDKLKRDLSGMLQWINDLTLRAERLMQSGIPTDIIIVHDKIHELNKLKTETSCKETHFNKISEDQHLKYLRKNSLLPAELSSMIGRIRVAMASLNKNLKEKEKEMDVIYGKLLIFDSSTQEIAEQMPSVRLKESLKKASKTLNEHFLRTKCIAKKRNIEENFVNYNN